MITRYANVIIIENVLELGKQVAVSSAAVLAPPCKPYHSVNKPLLGSCFCEVITIESSLFKLAKSSIERVTNYTKDFVVLVHVKTWSSKANAIL